MYENTIEDDVNYAYDAIKREISEWNHCIKRKRILYPKITHFNIKGRNKAIRHTNISMTQKI
jgi:hypothetical protein